MEFIGLIIPDVTVTHVICKVPYQIHTTYAHTEMPEI